MDQRLKDLNLLLIYLSGWEEDSRKRQGEKIYRAYKWYRYEVLNELERDKMIYQCPNSLILTGEGKQRAEGLKQKLL